MKMPVAYFLRPEPDASNLKHLAEHLRGLRLGPFLRDLLGGEWEGCFTGHYHLGYLVQPRVAAHLPQLAQEAGLHLTGEFESQIVASELGVPTRIVRARGGEQWGMEWFVPGLSEEAVKPWFSRPAASHLGIGVRQPGDLERVRERLQGKGFCLPGFLRAGPAPNTAEQILVLYLDGPGGRLEFYWRERESP